MAQLRRRRRVVGAAAASTAVVLGVLLPLALSGGSARPRSAQPVGQPTTTVAPVASVRVPAPTTTASPPISTALAPPSSVRPTTTTGAYAGPKLTSVSSAFCADATHCWAGASAGASGNESAILASRDGGATWTAQDLIPDVEVGPIDCPSDTHCLAAANRVVSNQPPLLLSTTDGGKTWSASPLASQVYELDAISCVNDSTCWLVGAQPQTEGDIVMATSNWGGSWSVQDRASIDISMGVGYGISCLSTSDCVIVGIGALTTTNGGSTWQKYPVPGELNAISCPSVSLCVAEEDVTSAIAANESTTIAVSADGGATWKDVETVGRNVGVLGSISCPTTALCVSVGNGYTYTSGSGSKGQSTLWGAIETTTDGGKTWTIIKEPEVTDLFGVSCAVETTDCVAVGASSPPNAAVSASSASGVILKSADGGTTWTQGLLPGA